MKSKLYFKSILIITIPITILVFLSFLSCNKSTPLYGINVQQSLDLISNSEYLISLDKLNDQNNVLVDVRNSIEFEKGHLENAINIFTPNILESENQKMLDEFKQNGKTIILYGISPHDALSSYMILTQLGFDNIKIATIDNYYSDNKLVTKNMEIESSVNDINYFIEQSAIKAAEKPKPEPIKERPKKIIPLKKVKKMPVEGGC